MAIEQQQKQLSRASQHMKALFGITDENRGSSRSNWARAGGGLAAHRRRMRSAGAGAGHHGWYHSGTELTPAQRSRRWRGMANRDEDGAGHA